MVCQKDWPSKLQSYFLKKNYRSKKKSVSCPLHIYSSYTIGPQSRTRTSRYIYSQVVMSQVSQVYTINKAEAAAVKWRASVWHALTWQQINDTQAQIAIPTFGKFIWVMGLRMDEKAFCKMIFEIKQKRLVTDFPGFCSRPIYELVSTM